MIAQNDRLDTGNVMEEKKNEISDPKNFYCKKSEFLELICTSSFELANTFRDIKFLLYSPSLTSYGYTD